MIINDDEIGRPLLTLRALLGDGRVEELQEHTHPLLRGLSSDECVVVAEFARLTAETRAWKEARRESA